MEGNVYNKDNFFEKTFCLWQWKAVLPKKFNINNADHQSERSLYFYTKEGVYRLSDHWGKARSCYWLIKNTKKVQELTGKKDVNDWWYNKLHKQFAIGTHWYPREMECEGFERWGFVLAFAKWSDFKDKKEVKLYDYSAQIEPIRK